MTVPTLTPEQVQEQQDILDSGTARQAYDFAYYTSGADIDALQKVIVDSGDLEWVCKFARDIDGADTGALQQAVVDSRSFEYAHWFALVIPEADLKALIPVIKTGEDAARYMADLANKFTQGPRSRSRSH